MVPRKMTLAERLDFHSIPEPNSGCLLWTAKCTPSGHGMLKWGRAGKMAHRLAWTAHRSPIPDGLLVCHKCDVPSCINPAHLFLGTTQDNTADKMRKGRHRSPRGSRHGWAKLTESQALEIRKSDGSARVVAAEYGVSRATVSLIRSNKIWRHI